MPVFFLRSGRSGLSAPSGMRDRLRLKAATALLSKENASYSEDNRLEQILTALPSQACVLLPPRRIDEYVRMDKVIGRGGFATVYRGSATDTGLRCIPALEPGVTYAVRRPDTKYGGTPILQHTLSQVSPAREIEFLQGLANAGPCQGLVRVVAFFCELPSQRCSLVMEYLDGPDLYDYLSTSSSPLCERDAGTLIRQAVVALHYLHRTVGALHRDVKPDNFGFAKQVLPGEPLPVLKLFDFGSIWVLPSPITEEDARTVQFVPHSSVGTALYVAPEVWDGSVGAPSDMWAVGVLSHLLLTLELPFGLFERTDYRQAIHDPLDFDTPSWAGLSVGARDFVASLLERRPDARPTTSSALSTQWLARTSPEQSSASVQNA